jgi:hypothetical protein
VFEFYVDIIVKFFIKNSYLWHVFIWQSAVTLTNQQTDQPTGRLGS